MKETKFRWMLTMLFCVLSLSLWSQDAHVVGHISDENNQPMPFVSIQLKDTSLGGLSDETGHYFLKDLPAGHQTLVISCVGYLTEEREVELKHNSTLTLNVVLREETFMMNGVVVTSNKYTTKRKESATIVNVVSPFLFESTSAHCTADVLSFQTGLRVEQTCSNCGVPQLRINGMEGQYSQILMDSRPIFSSLASVYGLEQVPAGMVDRIEVIRGGGSALYGANAIAGVVNIITKEPTRNFANIDHNSAYMESGAYDLNTSFNASLVTDNQRAGIFIFGVQRNRKQYDRDDDGFSDIPLLNSTTVGARAFFRTSDLSRLTAEYHHLAEYRRGGCDTDRPPHETDLAEQLRHSIDAGSLNWNTHSCNDKHYLQLYSSLQNIRRESYFGTSKNPNAYGNTHDVTAVLGAQYRYSYPFVGTLKGDISAGAEYTYNRLHDKMLGYNRDMLQEVNIAGGYLQNEWKNEQLSILLGGRLEKHNLLNNIVFSPRANLRYTPVSDVILRLTYASGYRAPQAYDEDLHVGAVGGEVSLITLAPDLKPEYSHSFSGSVDYYTRLGSCDANFTVEGFYTRLTDVFALVESGHDSMGNLLLTRTNSSGAYVTGVNLEAKVGYGKLLLLQGGYTLQRSRYTEDFAWSENERIAPQRRMFRTPDQYGYFLASLTPLHDFTIAVNGKITGDMLLQHYAGYVAEDEETHSGTFFELGVKLSKLFHLYKHYSLELNAGVKNLLNQFQGDIDQGKDRDASYIYGPAQPRTWFVGVNVKL
ncbi:MAG: TonB-dependent receptor [Prevotella sp.]|nr:TonB-dependent receptor [Prevotella sp.]